MFEYFLVVRVIMNFVRNYAVNTCCVVFPVLYGIQSVRMELRKAKPRPAEALLYGVCVGCLWPVVVPYDLSVWIARKTS